MHQKGMIGVGVGGRERSDDGFAGKSFENDLKMHTQSLFDRNFTHTREKEDVKILMYTPICDIIKQARAAIECRKGLDICVSRLTVLGS